MCINLLRAYKCNLFPINTTMKHSMYSNYLSYMHMHTHIRLNAIFLNIQFLYIYIYYIYLCIYIYICLNICIPLFLSLPLSLLKPPILPRPPNFKGNLAGTIHITRDSMTAPKANTSALQSSSHFGKRFRSPRSGKIVKQSMDVWKWKNVN